MDVATANLDLFNFGRTDFVFLVAEIGESQTRDNNLSLKNRLESRIKEVLNFVIEVLVLLGVHPAIEDGWIRIMVLGAHTTEDDACFWICLLDSVSESPGEV